jgi:hypothetical protein
MLCLPSQRTLAESAQVPRLEVSTADRLGLKSRRARTLSKHSAMSIRYSVFAVCTLLHIRVKMWRQRGPHNARISLV